MKAITTITTALIFAVLAELCSAQVAQEPVACGRPDFNRTNNRGVFIWQNCGSGDWFLRASNGGRDQEFQVEGRLRSDRPLVRAQGFSLELGQDTFDTSDPSEIRFRFRVFATAQDGFDFKLADFSPGCLTVTTSEGVPLMFGADNVALTSPLNLRTLGKQGCGGGLLPPIMLLLDDEV